MKALLALILVGSAALAGHFVTVGTQTSVVDTAAAESARTEGAAAPAVSPDGLVMHEWGTFTSFSGSDGVPVNFQPNNSDLPGFVYDHFGREEGDKLDLSKSRLLRYYGKVSMETPVMYFYTAKEMQASIQVDFPKGWITEWYPYAAVGMYKDYGVLSLRPTRNVGQTIRWNVKLLPGEPDRFPREKGENPYYHARETDAVPLQASFELPENPSVDPIRGGSITQREKFLFYRGVGTFTPPVTVQAMNGGKVRVLNSAGGKVTGLFLVTVRNGQIAFKALDALEAGGETVATLPETASSSTELGAAVEKGLIAAGLYEREARAMVKTWDHAWFQEEGARILYVLPRTRTDELLPVTVSPQPSETVRVMVGRHDFLTPEQETIADAQIVRIQAAQAELNAAQAELIKLGRFSLQAQQQAGERVYEKTKK
jgi:hypothetical protein